MTQERIVEEAKNKLVTTYDPIKIYLFGSYAWGSPTKESDLDLLVVVEDSKDISYRRPIAGRIVLADLMVPKDILVYTRDEFEKKSQDVTSLCHKIVHEGKQIYAKS